MPESLLAFDFGYRRVGIGLGIMITGTASPIHTIEYRDQAQLWSQIDTLVQEWQPQLLVVGMPRHLNGDVHELAKPIQRFANQLEKQYHLPVEFIDERLSSQEASARLKTQRQGGRKKRISKQEIDRQSAAILAENWMNQHG